METARSTMADTPHKPFYTHLYVQVLTAIVLGVLLGHFYPQLGEAMKPLGDGFIKLIKMLIAPIIFCTVVHGIASMEDMKKVGRVGLKALIYFEVVTTLALIVGLDRGQHPAARRRHEHRRRHDRYQARSRSTRPRPGSRARSSSSCTSSPTPWSAPSPRARSCRCCSSPILFAFGLHVLGERGKPLLAHHRPGLRMRSSTIVGIIMKAGAASAPSARWLSRSASMASARCSRSAQLMLAFYATCLIFVFVVLGAVAWLAGFSIFKFITLHQGGAADRARHLLLRIGAAAHDGEDGEPRLRASRWSGW